MPPTTRPACGHSACSQNYIDTGETACIAPVHIHTLDPHHLLDQLLPNIQSMVAAMVAEAMKTPDPNAYLRDKVSTSFRRLADRLAYDKTLTGPAKCGAAIVSGMIGSMLLVIAEDPDSPSPN